MYEVNVRWPRCQHRFERSRVDKSMPSFSACCIYRSVGHICQEVRIQYIGMIGNTPQVSVLECSLCCLVEGD